jgi:hypothetical protein
LDPDNPPPGYHAESRIRGGLVLGGALLLAIPYVIGAGVAAGADGDGNRRLDGLYVPVVGPFIAIAQERSFAGDRNDLTGVGNAFGGALMIVDGILQVGGLAMVVVGVAAQKTVVVRDRNAQALARWPAVAVGARGAAARWTF